jgi:hypothetical protein
MLDTGRRLSLADLLLRPLAEAEIAGLPLPHDLGQRLHGLLERDVPVVAMALVEVDVVGAEPVQGGIDLREDLVAR